MKIVKLQFAPAGKLYDFLAGTLSLSPRDRVVVETDRGKSIATVVLPPTEVPDDFPVEGMKSVLRLATDDDLAIVTKHAEREEYARRFCIERIRERKLEMKLVRCEYQFDASKAVFYFTAEGRIDFRELVKDLAHHLRIRIEMRQIGVRDESKLVGGLGICGRELCCSTFLREFAPVSVKMAKEQNLALNPAKISGQCGRLLCCLGYEYETYQELKKGLPRCGKTVSCGPSCSGDVTKIDILRRMVTIRTANQKEITVPADELSLGPGTDDKAKEPAARPVTHPPEDSRQETRPDPAPDSPKPQKQPAATDTPPAPPRKASRRRQRRHTTKGRKGNDTSSSPEKEDR